MFFAVVFAARSSVADLLTEWRQHQRLATVTRTTATRTTRKDMGLSYLHGNSGMRLVVTPVTALYRAQSWGQAGVRHIEKS
jgi:hypothetical protein